MKLAASSLAWSPAQDEWVAQQLLRYGVQAIDITPGKYFDLAAPDLAAAATFRDWWKERGITVTGMQSLLFGRPDLQVFGSVEMQKKLLTHLEGLFALAAVLGASQLTFGSPRQRDRGRLTACEAWDKGLTFFAQVAQRAARQGVTLALEPNPPAYGANFLTGTLETAQFVRELNQPALRLQLDTGALMLEGVNPSEVVPQVLDVVSHLHLSLPHLTPLTEQLTDYVAPELLRMVQDAVLVAEMLPPDTTEEFLSALNILQRYGDQR